VLCGLQAQEPSYLPALPGPHAGDDDPEPRGESLLGGALLDPVADPPQPFVRVERPLPGRTPGSASARKPPNGQADPFPSL